MKTSKELKQDIVFDVTLRGRGLTFHSTWGLFSPRGIDNGSYLLIEHIDVRDGQWTLDLGCGYGAIGLAIAKACPGGTVHLVDTDFVAVDFARKNAELNALANCTARPPGSRRPTGCSRPPIADRPMACGSAKVR